MRTLTLEAHQLTPDFFLNQLSTFANEDLFFSSKLFEYHKQFFKRGLLSPAKVNQIFRYDEKKVKMYTDFCSHYKMEYRFIEHVEQEVVRGKFKDQSISLYAEITVYRSQYNSIVSTILNDYAKSDSEIHRAGNSIASKIENLQIVSDAANKLLGCGRGSIIAGRQATVIDVYVGETNVSADFNGDSTTHIVGYNTYNLKPLTSYDQKQGLFVAILNKYKELSIQQDAEYVFGSRGSSFIKEPFNIIRVSKNPAVKREAAIKDWY